MSESTDKDLPDEQQLDEYLRGGSAVSRQYRQLRSADVPTELDRLVLRQAQEAVKARPAKSRAWMRWSGPLALAASVVLVVSIVIESGVRDELMVTPASAPVQTQILREPAEETVDSRAAESGAPALTEPQAASAPAEERAQSADRASVRKMIKPAAPSPAAAAQPESPPPAMREEAPPSDLERRATVEPIPRRDDMPAGTTAARKREADMAEDDIASVIVTGMRRPLSGNEQAARTVQESFAGEQSRVAGPRNTVAVPAPPMADDAQEADEQPRSYTDPEQWLHDIRQLREEKKYDEADREWRRFRDAFPNYAVEENDPARGALR